MAADEEPRGGDEQLLAIIEDWNGLSAEEIAESFNEEGNWLIDSFLDRHVADMPDGTERRLREMLKSLEADGATFAEEGAKHTDAPIRLRHLLTTQVVPIMKSVLRASMRARETRGSRDFIPGRATEVRADREQAAKKQIEESINSQVRMMPEYGRLQDLETQQFGGGTTTEDEYRMYSAQKEVLKRSIYLWGEADKRAHGVYGATVAKLRRDLRNTERAIESSHSRMWGEGAAAAQSQVDKQLRDRERPLTPLPWRRERLEDMFPSPPGFGSPTPALMGVPKPTPSRTDLPIPSPSKSPSPPPLEPGTPPGQLRRSQLLLDRSILESDEPDADFLGYNLPFSATNPQIYQDAYGVRAKDVVDLFRTNHRQLDYGATAQILLKLMMEHDPTIGLNLPLPDFMLAIQGDRDWGQHTFEDILAARIKHQKTIRNGIGANFSTRMEPDEARELIKKGKPNQPKVKRKNAPKGSTELAPLRDQAHSIRPFGLVVELFNRWRLSGAAERAGLTGTDPLQLFSYHRRQGALRLAGSPSAERGSSGFRQELTKRNYSRAQLKVIGSLFGTKGRENPFDPDFWRMNEHEQLASMKGKTGQSNPNNWINVLENGIVPPVPLASLKITRQTATGYSDEDRLKLWQIVSSKMREFMLFAGENRSFSEAGDYLAVHAAGLEPSPLGHYPTGASRRSRSREVGDVGDVVDLTQDGDEDVEPRQRAGKKKRSKRLTMADAVVEDVHGLPRMSKTGSYNEGPPGSHLYNEWESMLDAYRSKPGLGRGDSDNTSRKMEENLLFELGQARDRRKGAGYKVGKVRIASSFHLYTNVKGNSRNEDKDSFKMFLDKIAWNAYINGLSERVASKAQKAKLEFADVPDKQYIFEQIFRPGDSETVADTLQKWIAARIWNHNANTGSDTQVNMKKIWEARISSLIQSYELEEVEYKRKNLPFPIPDWKDRLRHGNQYFQLHNAFNQIVRKKERIHERYAAPDSGPADDEKVSEPVAAATPAKRRRKGTHKPRAAGTSGGLPPPEVIPETPVPRIVPRKPRREPQPARVEKGQPAQPHDVLGADGRREMPPGVHPVSGPGIPPTPAIVLNQPPGFQQRPGQPDALMGAAAAREAAIAQVPLVRLPVRAHDNRLRAEVVRQENYEALNGVHLMQTDNNVQPVMGAVHMVRPERNYSDKHFMLDVEGDINEGNKVLVERSRRGPFQKQRGRSTVMDRSTHVTYRKRAGAFEITVRRGVISAELKQMLSKLSMHRLSIHGSRVVIIKGAKRYRLGPLAELDLKYLMELVDECLQQYGTCGLELTESRAGSGALYKAGVHGARFKSSARRGAGR